MRTKPDWLSPQTYVADRLPRDEPSSSSLSSSSWPAGLVAVLGLLLALPLACLLYLSAIALAGPLLAETPSAGRADVLVVLGGDGPARAQHAVSLLADRRADQVIVTGDGDCTFIAADIIRGSGIAPERVAIECRSGSTWQNAEFSCPILARLKAGHALIVTSWFHEKRALMSFRALCPAVAYAPAPVPPPKRLATLVFGPDGPQIAKEYVKLAAYWLRTHLPAAAGGPANSGNPGRLPAGEPA